MSPIIKKGEETITARTITAAMVSKITTEGPKINTPFTIQLAIAAIKSPRKSPATAHKSNNKRELTYNEVMNHYKLLYNGDLTNKPLTEPNNMTNTILTVIFILLIIGLLIQ